MSATSRRPYSQHFALGRDILSQHANCSPGVILGAVRPLRDRRNYSRVIRRVAERLCVRVGRKWPHGVLCKMPDPGAQMWTQIWARIAVAEIVGGERRIAVPLCGNFRLHETCG